jgi:hypothetical protein
MLNRNQWQKFPTTFSNNFTVSKEMYNGYESKPVLFKTDIPFASCPTPPKPSDEQLGSVASQICKTMGIESCKTSSYTAQAEVDAFLASASLNVSGSSTVGCDQVMAMANSYYQSQQNISCVLKQTSTKNQTTVTGINSININALRDDFIAECPLEIDQKLRINLVELSQLSQEQKNEIAKSVKTTTDDIVKTLQDSKSGFGATPQGSKYISDTLSKIQNIDFNQNVTQTLNEITTSVQGGNTINITAGRSVILKGSQCKISQDSVIDIMATSILNDQISNIFTSMSEMTKKTTTDNTQKSDNQGMPNLFEGKWVKYLMMGIAVIVLFGGISYAASKQDWGEISKNVVAAKTGGASGIAGGAGVKK